MKTALVLTSIHPPTAGLRLLASGSIIHGWDMLVAGDSKSPSDFHLEGCRFLSIEKQRKAGFTLGSIAPEQSYTRKNLGYLEAMRSGAGIIVETDDDNLPYEAFWSSRQETIICRSVCHEGWVNAYRYFTNDFIYPRGLPLTSARDKAAQPAYPSPHVCPIQQGLADDDPDVDAVFRMLFQLPLRFERDALPVILQPGTWCPFNSQNTTFFPFAFPLLYLPAYCSFRMTDIWRSFIAQRILHSYGFGVMFHGPTVHQDRNKHDLMMDFQEEMPGYLHNVKIREALNATTLHPADSVRLKMESCYQTMIRRGWIGAKEESLLAAWFDDLESLAIQSHDS